VITMEIVHAIIWRAQVGIKSLANLFRGKMLFSSIHIRSHITNLYGETSLMKELFHYKSIHIPIMCTWYYRPEGTNISSLK
ncbi:unnamed protein product, partial [Dovyalis caffra]